MSTGNVSVFGNSSEDEDEERVRRHRKRALRTLNELQKEAEPSEPQVHDASIDDDFVVCEDEEREMARLRSAPAYMKFEKDFGRRKPNMLLKKRKARNEQQTHIQQPDSSPASNAYLDTGSQADCRMTSALSPKRDPVGAMENDQQWKKARKNGSVAIVNEDRMHSVAKSARRRKRIDPKIIDDTSESGSSDADSDACQLGPQFPEMKANNACHLPLRQNVRFGAPHDGYVSSISIDPAGARMVTGSNDGFIKFWDFNTMDSTMNAFKTTDPFGGGIVKGATFSSTGGQLLCWGALPNARVLDREGRPLAQTATGDMYIVDAARSMGHPGPIRSTEWLSVSGGNQREIATIANEGTVRIWDIDSARRRPMEDIPVMTQVNVFKLRNEKGTKTLADVMTTVSDGAKTLIAVGCNDETVKLLDPRVFSLRPAQQFCDVITRGSNFTSIVASPSCCAAPLLLVRSTDDALRVLDRRRLDRPAAEFGDLPNTVSETNACFLDVEGDFFGTGTSASRRGNTKPARLAIFSRKSMAPALYKDIEKEAGSIVCLSWHSKLNQIFYGCGNGTLCAVYDAETSIGGVLKCVVKEGRKKVHGHFTSGLGPIFTPGSAATHMGVSADNTGDTRTKREVLVASKARQPRLERGPESSKLGTTSSLEKYVREAGMRQDWIEDPREALLRLDKETKKNPIFTRAYTATQPKVLLAEKTAEQEEEDAMRNAAKFCLAKKTSKS